MVSGGADSVAMLRLVLMQPVVTDVRVVHINHQVRGRESDADEAFVRDLAFAHSLAIDVFRADQLPSERPSEEGWRNQRHHAMREVARTRPEVTFAVAHTLDDVVETALLRLLRGGEPWSLASMRAQTRIQGLNIARPLLNVRRRTLREWLVEIGQPWREDSSNSSNAFLRNRVRAWLDEHPDVVPVLQALTDTARALDEATSEAASRLAPTNRHALRAAAPPVARRCLRAWLVSSGVPLDGLSAQMIDRVLATAIDAAAPARISLPGGFELRRTKEHIELHSPRER